MKRSTLKEAAVVLAQYALLVCVTQVGNALFGGVLKGFGFVVFALLLLFVVGRSTTFLRNVTIICRGLLSSFLLQSRERWSCEHRESLVIPEEPPHHSRFQRPPPAYSL
jgi:hypothetical protein